jgi:hypothetical protein
MNSIRWYTFTAALLLVAVGVASGATTFDTPTFHSFFTPTANITCGGTSNDTPGPYSVRAVKEGTTQILPSNYTWNNWQSVLNAPPWPRRLFCQLQT